MSAAMNKHKLWSCVTEMEMQMKKGSGIHVQPGHNKDNIKHDTLVFLFFFYPSRILNLHKMHEAFLKNLSQFFFKSPILQPVTEKQLQS